MPCHLNLRLFMPLVLCSLAACEQLGIADPAKQAEAKSAEGQAVGGACRHAGRALEDCYALNPGALKAAVFNGWKEMNDYMAQNKIETVKPEVPAPAPAAKPAKAAEEESAADEEPPPKTSSRVKRSVKPTPSAH